MTKHFITTFTNNFTGEQIEIETKVTDRQESRTAHKRPYATEKAVQIFDRDHIRYSHNEESGTTNIYWTFRTKEA